MTDTLTLPSDPIVSDLSEESIDPTVRQAVEQAVDTVLERVSRRVEATPFPTATYRLQFHKEFTFRQATELVPYLHELGITHVYASPYLKAQTGSTHGYDIVDHSQLNPELGSADDFQAFIGALRAHGMGHILDFVPNHMGVGSDENPWWQDVLENGPASQYSHFFDIDWNPLKSDLINKVLLPVLGEQYGRVLEEGQLELKFDAGAFYLSYFGRRFPIAPGTYSRVLKHRLEELQTLCAADPAPFDEYQSILTAIGHLPARNESDPEKRQERVREKEVIKRRLQRLCEDSSIVRDFILLNVSIFNGVKGDPAAFDALDALLQDQAYRLSYWRVAADEVNYRRFFDVNQLAAVCMEHPEVFAKTHVLVMQLFEEGKLDGLRIDHADGLYAPTEYLWQLQKARCLQLCRQEFAAWIADRPADDPAGVTWEAAAAAIEERFDRSRREGVDSPALRPMYLVVEKILEGKESLPQDWPVHGTTGYEFMNQVNGLFVRGESGKAFDAFYARFIGGKPNFDELIYQSKRLIMRVSMTGELQALGHQIDRLSEQNRRSRDFTLTGLTHALREIVACFPVYRTYTTTAGVLGRDRRYIEQAVARAKQRNPAFSRAEFDFVREILLLNLPGLDSPPGGEGDVSEASSPAGYDRERVLRFIGRFQQFTGPMMAKSVEDTAYYNFQRLISLNEVGGDPRLFGESVDNFHQFNQRLQSTHPRSLTATETHDAKRGEDTRTRIDVLSEDPTRWRDNVLRWARWNKRKKVSVGGELAPTRNDEYLIYQTLIGTWPFEPPKGPALAAYLQRINDYLTKALREGKVSSSWIAPNEAYEQATHEFIASILADDPPSAFRTEFEPLAREVALRGMWNSLSQTLLKITSPGVPDVYQGTEFWDLTLVDPDNRRPVDYPARRRALQELQSQAVGDRTALVDDLLKTPADGRIKLYVLTEALRIRREHPELFTVGDYLPLRVIGSHATHICAFARQHAGEWALAAVPRLTTDILPDASLPPIGGDVWADTKIELPAALQNVALFHALTGEIIPPNGKGTVAAAAAFARLPAALLTYNLKSSH